MQALKNLTTKQIITYVVLLALAIFVVWYVIDALDGFDPAYRPGMEGVFYAAGSG